MFLNFTGMLLVLFYWARLKVRKYWVFFFKIIKIRKFDFVFKGPVFVILFLSQDKYITNRTINDKSVHGVLGTQTRDGRMVGADKSSELRQHP